MVEREMSLQQGTRTGKSPLALSLPFSYAITAKDLSVSWRVVSDYKRTKRCCQEQLPTFLTTAYEGYVRNTCLCRARHKHVYLEYLVMSSKVGERMGGVGVMTFSST
jgi:hypothetical protein